MSRSAEVYDLGTADPDLRRDRPKPAAAPAAAASVTERRPSAGQREHERVAWFASDVTCSLSVFLPGASQMALGRITEGLFYVSTLAFLGALSAAILETVDRLVPTLELLGRSTAWVCWMLGVAFVLGAALHLAAVWTAWRPGDGREYRALHPAVPAAASLIVPGWGQVLNGDRLRAMLFLGGCWIVAGTWILSSAWATDLFNTYAPVVAPWEQSARAPLAMWTLRWTAPVVLWSLAVYDAMASAAARAR